MAQLKSQKGWEIGGECIDQEEQMAREWLTKRDGQDTQGSRRASNREKRRHLPYKENEI